MNPESTLPSYTELADLLDQIQSTIPPAEIHGVICGYLCIAPNPEKFDSAFETILLRGKKSKKAQQLLQEFSAISHQHLKQFSFEFSLILPEDETDINIRAEALGLWCQGFLTGLAQSPTVLENHPNQEIVEALSDLTEIAQISYGDIPANEEDETAYFELVEYVRLTALMIYNELNSSTVSQKLNENTLLH